MTLKEIFICTHTIEVNGEPEAIVKQLELRTKSRSRGRFTGRTFRFMLAGAVGIHRFHEMCYVSGESRKADADGRCTVHYSIYPGIIFWICAFINFMFFMGHLIFVATLKDSIYEFFLKVLIINVMLLIVETLEARHQQKRCNEKIERIVKNSNQ